MSEPDKPDLLAMLRTIADNLDEAAELVEEWGSYDPEHFRLDDPVRGNPDKLKEYARLIRENVEGPK